MWSESKSPFKIMFFLGKSPTNHWNGHDFTIFPPFVVSFRIRFSWQTPAFPYRKKIPPNVFLPQELNIIVFELPRWLNQPHLPPKFSTVDFLKPWRSFPSSESDPVPGDFPFQVKHVNFLGDVFSKKSPTGPTEQTPKPEYLIAPSQLP